MPLLRAGFYFDGFNFYHALLERGDQSLKWMSHRKLCEWLAKPGETVRFVKVFSAYRQHNPDGYRRHQALVKASEAEGVIWVMGHYKQGDLQCRAVCKKRYDIHSEKESDVNLALHLAGDCQSKAIDVAYLVTGDSDLVPAVKRVRDSGCNVRVINVAPPGRSHSYLLRDICHGIKRIPTGIVKQCRLDDPVICPDGTPVHCPAKWRQA